MTTYLNLINELYRHINAIEELIDSGNEAKFYEYELENHHKKVKILIEQHEKEYLEAQEQFYTEFPEQVFYQERDEVYSSGMD